MIYTEEIKRELDTIMKAYEEYIRENTYFDILYSEKAGYLRLVVEAMSDEPPIFIDTPDMFVETLLHDVADDIIYAKGAPLAEDEDLPEEVKQKIYRKMIDGVMRIEGDKAHYLDLANRCYQKRFGGQKN